tara:strand:+ start:69 stop:317 length:249 start_codon:yes stop_codon:yes gene_type:complete
MGATGSVLKRVRQSKRDNLRNRHYKSMMKTSIKRVLQSNKETSEELLKQAISTIDRLKSKGIIHKNRASSQKSRLTKYVNNL